MLVELRCYTFRPGTLGRFLRAYEQEALEVHRRHLGRLLGYFTTDSGELNQVVHLWGFTDHADRAARRAALYADPVWLAFSERVAADVLRMETRFLSPTAFSPIR